MCNVTVKMFLFAPNGQEYCKATRGSCHFNLKILKSMLFLRICWKDWHMATPMIREKIHRFVFFQTPHHVIEAFRTSSQENSSLPQHTWAISLLFMLAFLLFLLYLLKIPCWYCTYCSCSFTILHLLTTGIKAPSVVKAVEGERGSRGISIALLIYGTTSLWLQEAEPMSNLHRAAPCAC